MRLLKRRPSPAMIVATIALAVALGGVAFASIPSATGVITSCYVTATGAIRVVDAATTRSCGTGQQFLNWNQKGPAGPAGAKGATGPKGATGAKGGFKSIRRVVGIGKMSDAGSKKITQFCGSGEVATGGGHQLVGNISGRVVTRSFPVGGSPPTGWQVKARAPIAIGDWQVKTWVVCAKL
jgi:hypothetical protein